MVNKIVKTWLFVIWTLLTEAAHLEVHGCFSSVHPPMIDVSDRSRKWTLGWSNVKISCPEKSSDYQRAVTRWRCFPPISNETQKQKMAGSLECRKRNGVLKSHHNRQSLVLHEYLNISYFLFFPTIKYHNVKEVYTSISCGLAANRSPGLRPEFLSLYPIFTSCKLGWQHSVLCKLLWNEKKRHTRIHLFHGAWHEQHGLGAVCQK